MSFFLLLVGANSGAIASPEFDYNADNLSPATAVRSWVNKGTAGATYNLTMDSNAAAPILLPAGGPGGRKALRFNDIASTMFTPVNAPIFGNQARTAIIVTRSTNNTRDYFSLGEPTYVGSNFNFGNAVGRFSMAMAGIDFYPGGFTPDYWQVIGIIWDPAAKMLYLKADAQGVQGMSINALNTQQSILRVGGGNYTNSSFNFEVARFQLFARALTIPELTSQMAGIASYYGLPS